MRISYLVLFLYGGECKTFKLLSEKSTRMSVDARSVDEQSTAECEIVATVDDTGDAPQFVVADITRDGAWLSVPTGAACSLREWR